MLNIFKHYKNACQVKGNINFKNSEEKIPFEDLQKEYDELRKTYETLINAQFQAFKYNFAKSLRNYKAYYSFNHNKLDDDQYIKNRFKVILYGNIGNASSRAFDYLVFKAENDFTAKTNDGLIIKFPLKQIFEVQYLHSLFIPITYFCKLLLNIDRFKSFFSKYNEHVSSLVSKSKFEEYFNIYCQYFNIKPQKNIIILFDFLEAVYFLKEPYQKTLPDIDKFYKGELFAFTNMNTFTFSFLSLKNKAYVIPMFFHELTHFFQQKSNWLIEEHYSSIQDSERRYFTYNLPNRISDLSGWNKFLNSFHSSGKYIFAEFDAKFTSLEITNKLMYEEIFNEIPHFDNDSEKRSLYLSKL